MTTDYPLGISDVKRDLTGQIKMNETLDEYHDLIEVYRRMDGYDREMFWSIMQNVWKTAEKYHGTVSIDDTVVGRFLIRVVLYRRDSKIWEKLHEHLFF